MNSDDKIQVLAELDGWTIKSRQCPHSGSVREFFWFAPDDEIDYKFRASVQYMYPSGHAVGSHIPENFSKKYLTSWDDLIPLIDKQPLEIKLKMQKTLFNMLVEEKSTHNIKLYADCLIKMIGKWKEE